MNNIVSNNKGFTLIELLIAITLCGVITVISVTGIRFGLRNIAEKQHANEHHEDFKSYISIFRQQLQQLHPARLGSPGSKRLAFYGNETNIIFVSYLGGHRGISGLYALNYKFNKSSSELSVNYDYWDPEVWSRVKNRQNSRTILSEVELISYNFFNHKEKKWVNSWNDPHRLPSLVSIDIKMRNEKKVRFISKVNVKVDT